MCSKAIVFAIVLSLFLVVICVPPVSAEKLIASNHSLDQTRTVPRTMTYQGVLKDVVGDPVADSFFDVIFRIYDAENDGNMEWIESFIAVPTDGEGYFTIQFANVDLTFDEDYWMELEIDNEILAPRQKINMTAYAARADTSDYAIAGAGWVDDGISVRLESPGDNLGIGTLSPSEKLEVTGNILAYGDLTAYGSVSADYDILAGDDVIATGDIFADGDISTGGNITSSGITTGSISANDIAITGDVNANGINVDDFQMPSGASSGHVLTSDGSGNGTWQSVPSSGLNGSGTPYYLPKFTGATSLANSQIHDGGAYVGIGTSSPSEKLEVDGNLRVNGKGIIGLDCIGTGNYCFVAGTVNEVSAQYGSIGGGHDNLVTNSSGSIGGGANNAINNEGYCAAIAGGYNNLANINYAFIGGGRNNKARGYGSVVCGGGGYYDIDSNSVDGSFGFIGAGSRNVASGYGASVVSGYVNRVYGDFSIIGNGERNYINGEYSVICGGYKDTINANYSCLFGIDSELSSDSTFMVDMPHIKFGNETTGYEFPTSDGSAGQVMTTDGNGQLGWTSNLSITGTQIQELQERIEQLEQLNSELISRIRQLEQSR